jgi:Flp pilus assembly protein TadG
MAVEMVVAVPAFLLLLLLVAGAGNWVSATDQVGAAARDAARAASLARSPGDAQSSAASAADYDLGNLCTGDPPTVTLTFTPTADFTTATAVQVKVQCTINLHVFRIVGLSTDTPFTSQAAAPLDPFVFRAA